jgi:predicted enzyme related to lactoylglutathione lyase
MVDSVDPPRLEHVRVNVSDFNRAVAWYESILELRAESYWPPEAPKYAHFQTGAAQFALSELEPVPAAGRFNFSVRDVDAWWEKLYNRAQVVEPLFDTPYGTRKFTIKDPDGNELGFVKED